MKPRLPSSLQMVICACCMLLIPSCRPGPPERIAFLSDTEDNGREFVGHVFFTDIHGSQPVQLNTGLAEDGCPFWSKDGKRIVFVSDNHTDGAHSLTSLYTIGSDGSLLTRLVEEELGMWHPSWAPDASEIAYSAGNGNLISLYKMNSDGSQITPLANSLSEIWYLEFDAEWSPDGQWILFSANPSDGKHGENPYFRIFKVNVDQRTPIELAGEADGSARWPVWSPENKQVAFQVSFGALNDNLGWSRNWDHTDIFVMNADGSNKQQITHADSSIENVMPSWSPDGKKIAFASNRDHPEDRDVFDIYVMDVDGSHVVRLTTSGNNHCPAWQP